jgi:hypothetical protein
MMLLKKVNKKLLVPLALILVVGIFIFSTDNKKIDFSAQVKPILNQKCISCHGGVKQEAGFSLLFRPEALGNTESGKPAIIPGDPSGSEMIRRLHEKDPDERMPYKKEPLTDKEIDILTSWIKQGAQWGEHWAYVPVAKQEVPKPASRFFGLIEPEPWPWVKNDIDFFVYNKLKEMELKPAAEADRATLLRRASLDITGLPASSSLSQKFLHSTEPGAYNELVDSLLASPHFGEKWTAMWMDLARYADTKGYERDDKRSIWRYRDWLIQSFNEDKPYNQFLTEQIAGDLLPGATDKQLLATAFHRNTMTNDEGGTDNEEFRTAAVMDRVNSTWDGLLSTTFACVQCHSHPYDPFKHEEYYKFMAFFNNTRDEDTWADYPLLRHYSSEDSIKLNSITGWLQKNGFSKESLEVNKFLRTWQPAHNSLTADSFQNCELNDTKWLAMRNPSTARLKGVSLDGKTELIYRAAVSAPGGKWSIHVDAPDGPLLASIPIGTSVPKGWQVNKVSLSKASGVHDLYLVYKNPLLKSPDVNALQFDWFYFTQPLPGSDRVGYDSVATQYWGLLSKDVPTTPIMQDNPPEMHRISNVFDRGNWLVKGAAVEPDIPQSLGGLPQGAPRNRLGLAMWLTDKKNPLTARTMVNRLWEQLFGTGLVETLEDLGTQGAEPANKELLDHLSYRFMNELNWSVKSLLKEMVLSATYRQDSKLTKEILEKDPYNRLYARGPRVRLSAEQIRDQALSISGLLSLKMGGASVMPWQPEGIWMSPWNGATWKKSEGEDQYRRALYTYWKRTAPYPSMISFDGAAREICMPRRISTNTPLQALVSLNDSVYLEASRHFAYRMQKEAGTTDIKSAIAKGYELMMHKPITPNRLSVLSGLYSEAFSRFKKDEVKTCEMIGLNDTHNNPETAALVVVANAMLNLDELITKN